MQPILSNAELLDTLLIAGTIRRRGFGVHPRELHEDLFETYGVNTNHTEFRALILQLRDEGRLEGNFGGYSSTDPAVREALGPRRSRCFALDLYGPSPMDL